MPTLARSPFTIGRNDGSIEHPIHVEGGPNAGEILVHLSVLPSGHAKVIDYDDHPHPVTAPHPPEVMADKVRRFLELDGHKWLGHPHAPLTQAIEVKKVKLKHGLGI